MGPRPPCGAADSSAKPKASLLGGSRSPQQQQQLHGGVKSKRAPTLLPFPGKLPKTGSESRSKSLTSQSQEAAQPGGARAAPSAGQVDPPALRASQGELEHVSRANQSLTPFPKHAESPLMLALVCAQREGTGPHGAGSPQLGLPYPPLRDNSPSVPASLSSLPSLPDPGASSAPECSPPVIQGEVAPIKEHGMAARARSLSAPRTDVTGIGHVPRMHISGKPLLQHEGLSFPSAPAGATSAALAESGATAGNLPGKLAALAGVSAPKANAKSQKRKMQWEEVEGSVGPPEAKRAAEAAAVLPKGPSVGVTGQRALSQLPNLGPAQRDGSERVGENRTEAGAKPVVEGGGIRWHGGQQEASMPSPSIEINEGEDGGAERVAGEQRAALPSSEQAAPRQHAAQEAPEIRDRSNFHVAEVGVPPSHGPSASLAGSSVQSLEGALMKAAGHLVGHEERLSALMPKDGGKDQVERPGSASAVEGGSERTCEHGPAKGGKPQHEALVVVESDEEDHGEVPSNPEQLESAAKMKNGQGLEEGHGKAEGGPAYVVLSDSE
eukprot:TRINITY_DN1491_c0_g1_i4.p1 TRINITY_DN1491_c0_g1~~TRINITY_DN1491_c0_g1_i4.p1  ORF type:complete len:553 (-),score=114.12 TRINITY_DN1491_c0_g1_i4:580-2238(-)